MPIRKLTSLSFVYSIEGDIFTLLPKPNESEQYIELAPANPIGTFLTSWHHKVQNLGLLLLTQVTAPKDTLDSSQANADSGPLIGIQDGVVSIDVAVRDVGCGEDVFDQILSGLFLRGRHRPGGVAAIVGEERGGGCVSRAGRLVTKEGL